MKRSPVRNGYGYDTLQPGQVLSSSIFCHQAPPHMQRRQRSQRRKMDLFVEKSVLQFFINDRFHAIQVFVSCSRHLHFYKLLCFVSECSTQSLSLPCMHLDHDSGQVMKFVYMRTTRSVSILNKGLKLLLNLLQQQVFILLSLYLICTEYDCEAFDATSDEIRLMAFYLNPDFINVSLKT